MALGGRAHLCLVRQLPPPQQGLRTDDLFLRSLSMACQLPHSPQASLKGTLTKQLLSGGLLTSNAESHRSSRLSLQRSVEKTVLSRLELIGTAPNPISAGGSIEDLDSF